MSKRTALAFANFLATASPADSRSFFSEYFMATGCLPDITEAEVAWAMRRAIEMRDREAAKDWESEL